jgi:hypothetical protein
MKEERYTDEQIRAEVNKTLENPQLRRCSHCFYGEDCTRCKKLNIPISKYQYAGFCKHFITNEEKLVEEAKEAMALTAKNERKLNHILTMMLNGVEAAMLFMEDFEQRIEAEYKRAEARGTGDPKVRKSDRQWISNLSRAYKAIKKDLEGARRQYTHYFEPMLNKVFFDKESNVYDAQSYDDHMSDANELARVMMKYFDKAYLSFDNADAIEKYIDSLEGVGVMVDEDYKRYNLRR